VLHVYDRASWGAFDYGGMFFISPARERYHSDTTRRDATRPPPSTHDAPNTGGLEKPKPDLAHMHERKSMVTVQMTKAKRKQAKAAELATVSVADIKPTTRWLSLGLPECDVPVWQLKTEKDAIICGRFRGGVYARWLSLVVVVIALFASLGSGEKEVIGVIVLTATIVVVLLFLAIPAFCGFLSQANYRQRRTTMQHFIDQGMSGESVNQQMMKQELQWRQNAAILGAAAMVRR
jgi:hypothetical protein